MIKFIEQVAVHKLSLHVAVTTLNSSDSFEEFLFEECGHLSYFL